MARGPRIDAPGVAHHVMIRGIERRKIFHDTEDYESFLSRLDVLVPELGFRCFAWALMPNHVHLALQTGPVPLARLMARVGTGYALGFNHRHQRVGHLFQNRYRSRPVNDDRDLLGLILYIHRNPLRAGLVDEPDELGRFPWCGHGALSGDRPPRSFEAPSVTLRLFSDDPLDARRHLSSRMQTSEDSDPLEELRLGDSSRREEPPAPSHNSIASMEELIETVCAAHDLPRSALGSGIRGPRVVAVRAEVACRATRELGVTSRVVARALGVSNATVSRALNGGTVPSRALAQSRSHEVT